MDEWRQSLLSARKALGLSRTGLAELTGVSAGAIRAYEDGSRRPKRQSLETLLSALRVERVQGNAIREGAGFPPVRSLYDHDPDYYFHIDQLDDEVEAVPWPEFVANDAFEIVAANRMASALWRVDFHTQRARRPSHELNLLAVAGEGDFFERIENWDEILEFLAAMYKSKGDGPDDLAAPSPSFAQTIGLFTENNPALLGRLITAWSRAQARPAKVRESYRIVWNDPEQGRMTFLCTITTANERDGLAFSDWIPTDGRTWDALDAIARGARGNANHRP